MDLIAERVDVWAASIKDELCGLGQILTGLKEARADLDFIVARRAVEKPQHNHLLQVIASTHVHLDHHNCLEVIILNGKVKEIEKLGNSISSLKGVKLSRINIMTLTL